MHNLSRAKTPLLLAVATATALIVIGLQHKTNRLADDVAATIHRLNETIALALVHDREITERVIHLPEDGQVWSAVFVWPDNREADPHSRRLAALFASEPRLQSLLAQTKVHHYTPADPLYRTRYAASMGGNTPQFWLLKPHANPSEGTAVYAVAGAGIPASGKQMADTIGAAIAKICPRPKPTPQPTPNPQPDLTPVVPDLTPQPDPVDDSLPFWLWILPILAAGLGAMHESRRG